MTDKRRIRDLELIDAVDVANTDYLIIQDVSIPKTKGLTISAARTLFGNSAAANSTSQILRNIAVNVLDYGALGDGSTDDTAAIQSAIDAVGAAGGGYVLLPPGTFKITATLVINDPNVTIVGSGSDNRHTTSPFVAVNGGTIITWYGFASQVMVRFTSTDAATFKLTGGGLQNVTLNARAIAGYCLELISWNSGRFENLMLYDATIACLSFDVVDTLTDARDPQENIFQNVWITALSGSADGIRMQAETPGANPSYNTLRNFYIQVKDGVGINLYNCDNNFFEHFRVDVTGTGSAVVFNGSNSSATYVPRDNVIEHLTTADPIIARGNTSFTYASGRNYLTNLDQTNGTVTPTVESGAYMSHTFLDGTSRYLSLINGISAPSEALANSAYDDHRSANSVASHIFVNNSDAHVVLENSTRTNRWIFSVNNTTGSLRVALAAGSGNSRFNIENGALGLHSYSLSVLTSQGGANGIVGYAQNGLKPYESSNGTGALMFRDNTGWNYVDSLISVPFRANLVSLVAAGTRRANGIISYAAGIAYRWSNGASSISDLPNLLPAFETSILHFGARVDGSSDDSANIQAAINTTANAGGGIVNFPAGIIALGAQIVLKSNVTLKGVVGGTVIRPTTAIANGAYPIINENFTITDYTTRTDRDLGIDGITFDGSQRPFSMFPSSGYSTQASFILFGRCERPFVRNCTFRDYRSGWGIVGQGNRGANFSDNHFIRMGKEDLETGGIQNINYGFRMRNTITDISKANGAVITFATTHGLTTGFKYLRGVRGMVQLTDGEYNVTATTANTVTLGTVNSVSYNTFTFDPDAEMTDRYAIRSVGSVINNNYFRDLYRTAIYDSGDGTRISNNLVDGAGEAAIYCNNSKNALIINNILRNIANRDISGTGIEMNWAVNPIITGNQISNTECQGIAVIGMTGGTISRNVIKETGKTVGLVYPDSPSANGSGIVGNVLGNGKRAAIYLASFNDWPVKDVDVSQNHIIDTRDTMVTTNGVFITYINNPRKVQAVRLQDNHFAGLLGLDSNNWHTVLTLSSNNGVWFDYTHPTTGLRITQERSGTGLHLEHSDTVANITSRTAVAGAKAYAVNGRKSTEGAGLGTGVLVFGDGVSWRPVDNTRAVLSS